jgi:predicted nucleic acid-binding protein
MAFVLDASVALAWHFEDEASAYADRVLERLREDDALVPAIWPLEVANGLLAAERRSRLSPADVAAAQGVLSDLPITVNTQTLAEALGSVLDLARAQGLSAYDAAYLDLAMREGLALATQDDDLRAAATRVGVALID